MSIAPFLSIIIPVYNVEEYISRCLDSLLNQDLSTDKYEIIVVNDGTPDNSMIIVDAYIQRYTNIIRKDKQNGGVSSARNVGIEIANGEYLLFVDPDDAIEENTLGTIYSKLKENNLDILILNSHIHDVDTNKKTEEFIFPRHLSGKTLTGIEISNNGCMRGAVWGVAFKRRFIMDHKLRFSEGIKNAEDSLFIGFCYIFSSKISHFDLDYYKMYLRTGSASQSWDYARVKGMLNNLSVLRNFIKKHTLTKEQNEIVQKKIYGTISSMMYHFFLTHRLDKYLEIKNLIKKSGLYPIKDYHGKEFKIKICLLNNSFDLFCLPFLIRQLIQDLKPKLFI